MRTPQLNHPSELFRLAPVALLSLRSGVIESTNAYAEELFAMTHAELRGSLFIDLVPEPERATASTWLQSALSGVSTTCAFSVSTRGTPKILHWRASLLKGEDDQATGVLLAGTEPIQQEESETLFRVLFEQAAVGVAHVDTISGRFLRVNQKYIEILGYSREELLSLDLVKLSSPEEPALDPSYIEQIQEGLLREFSTEKRLRRKDGSTIWVNLTVSPIWLPGDPPSSYLAIVEDISLRKKAERKRRALEAQLRQSQKMEALGTLAGGISHDFNNILFAIIANAQLAQEELPSSHPAMESIKEISLSAERAASLVRQILAFSRKQPMKRSVISPRQAIEEVVRLLRTTIPATIEIAIEIAADTPNILADPTQLHQVLMNLGTNAWHALEEKSGRISFQTSAHTVAPNTPGPLAPGLHAAIAVRDNGRGIDEKIIDRIFEPFFSTKALGKGSGLGLSVVHGIITAHQGTITVESTPGAGTTFFVQLPATHSTPEQAPKPAPTPTQANGRIMIVDDERVLVETLTKFFTKSGYSCVGYTNPREAISAFCERPHDVDLIITDENMPGLSGTELARRANERRRDIPMIMISGRAENKTGLAEIGVLHQLQKPFRLREIEELVSQIINPK